MIEPGNHELDTLLAVMCACALLVQLHYLRPVFAGRMKPSLSAITRTAGWFAATVRYFYVLMAYGDIQISITMSVAIILLALSEIIVTFEMRLP